MNKKAIMLNGLLALLISFLVVGCTNWRFESSNFGDLLHAGKPQSFKQYAYFFVHKDPDVFKRNPESSYSLEEGKEKSYFFSARYRPLNYLFLALENHLFDYQELYYFLVSVFLHLLTSLLIFAFFRATFSGSVAFLGACFFAVNQAVGSWLGSVSHQQYQLEILMFFVVVFFLKKHLDSGRLRYLLMSLVTFLIALFFRETLIIFPLWALGFAYFYEVLFLKEVDYFKPILTFISYSLFCVVYVVLRSAHYPVALSYYYSKLSFNEFFDGRLNDLRLFFDDLLGTVLLPGDKVTKVGILLALLAVLFLFFKNSNNKKIALLFFMSGFIFMWPLLFRHYDSRYLYLPLLFFIAGFLYLLESIKTPPIRRFGTFAGLFVCAINMNFFMQRMQQRQTQAQAFNSMIDECFAHNLPAHKMVCFLNVPQEQFDNGTMQALCLKMLKKGESIFQPSVDASTLSDQSMVLALLEKEAHHQEVLFYAWDEEKKTISMMGNHTNGGISVS